MYSHKVCSQCKEIKPASQFSPAKETKSGLRYRCKVCNALQVAEWRKANPERAGEWQRNNKARQCQIVMAYYARNPGQQNKWSKDNPALAAACTARWRARNLELCRANDRARRRANLEKDCAKVNRRRAQKLRAIPSWANHFFIGEAYDLARLRSQTTGIKWEVDHIVPLLSRLVCGLHVEDNLAVIPATVNRKKSASTWPAHPMLNYEVV